MRFSPTSLFELVGGVGSRSARQAPDLAACSPSSTRWLFPEHSFSTDSATCRGTCWQGRDVRDAGWRAAGKSRPAAARTASRAVPEQASLAGSSPPRPAAWSRFCPVRSWRRAPTWALSGGPRLRRARRPPTSALCVREGNPKSCVNIAAWKCLCRRHSYNYSVGFSTKICSFRSALVHYCHGI